MGHFLKTALLAVHKYMKTQTKKASQMSLANHMKTYSCNHKIAY
jgi:hypothetical protein